MQPGRGRDAVSGPRCPAFLTPFSPGHRCQDGSDGVAARVEQPAEEKPVPAGGKEPLQLPPVSTGNDRAVRALGQGTGGHTRRAQQGGGHSHLQRAVCG